MESIWLKQLVASGLSQALETRKLVVVHCWATWNGYDREFARAIRNIKPHYDGSVDFFSLDVETDLGQELCPQWDVTDVPALVAIRDGSKLETTIGFRAAELFEAQITEVLDRWTRRNDTKPQFD